MIRTIAAGFCTLALAVSGAFAQQSTLTLYTSQPQQDAQRTVDAFMAANPTIRVEWVRDGTTQLMARLRAEFAAGNPRPDVLLIADAVTMESLKAENRLAAHPEANLSGYPDGVHDPQRFWFGTKLITTGIVVNRAAPMRPESWADLTRPELRGQIVMPSPNVSGAAMIDIAAKAQAPGLGWDYLRRLAENRVRPAGGNGDVMRQVAGGERLYGVIVDFLPLRERARGVPVEFVFPREGVSAISEPVAILRSARNVEAAKRFVDFLISRQGQELASAMGYMPALPGVPVPAPFQGVTNVRLLPFDAAAALRDDQAIRRQIREVFGE
jgi:iron(III) transport system substrate-binding protein